MSRSLRPLAELATPRRLWRIHRRFLSTEWTRLSETHSYLRDATRNREIHLIGTAHVSQKSADEVRDLIHLVRPSHVAVELCPSRAARLRAGDKEDQFALAVQQQLGGGHGFLGAGFQMLNNLWKSYGLIPGVDFKAALDAADAVGAPAHCIDRDVDETLRLLRGALSEVSFEKLMTTPPPADLTSSMSGLSGGMAGIAEAVEQLKNRQQVAAMRRFMNTAAPSIVEVMLHQRDRHMVRRLRETCVSGTAVGVVGLAHMDGIEAEWMMQEEMKKTEQEKIDGYYQASIDR